MKILYIGQLWQGGTCLQRMNAIKQLGHQVVPIDTTNKRRSFLLKVQDCVIGHRDLTGANKKILDCMKTEKIDMIWADKSLMIEANTIKVARGINPYVIIAAYSPDDMFNPRNQSKKYIDNVGLYDFHVTTKSCNVNELKGIGAKRVYLLDNAFCPEVHRPIAVSDSEKLVFGAPVGFVGAYEKDRANMMAFLSGNGVNVKVWGDWPLRYSFKRYGKTYEVIKKSLWGDDYTKAICSFEINLGFLRKCNRDVQTTRSVEIPACGGFLLAERTEEHLSLFKEGEEAEFFSDKFELLRKTKYYLTHPEERKAIALAGHERCMKDGYSNSERLKKLFKLIEK